MQYVTTALEDLIENMYSRMSVTDPKHPIEDIAKRLGVTILYRNRFPFCSEGFVTLNPHLPSNEKKQVFAHELKHSKFHVGIQLDMPLLFRQLQERQAKNFAYHFCVPTFMLREMTLASTRVRSAVLIAETFNVTYDFAERRLSMYLNRLHSNEFYQKVSESRTMYM